MKLNKIKVLTVLFLIAIQCGFCNYAANAISDTQIQNAILVHINDYRTHHGLSPLRMDERIVKEAKKHSLDMAQHRMGFGHTYFEKRVKSLYGQIENSGGAAENVAYNYKDARDVVKNWVLSPGHRRNIEGNYNLTGIGIARDAKGKIYFTQIFLKTGNTVQVSRRPVFSRPLHQHY